ncbi:MAG: hypothetical protein MH321_13560 [Leptospiraceae bacterium]|nr:hypothetical protein [Leptospiraceae bacterium]
MIYNFILFSISLFIFFAELRFKLFIKKYGSYGSLIVFSIFTLYLFGQNLNAKWWLIDDHETFRFLGNNLEIRPFSEFINILINQTEVGQFGTYPRYRPSYYFFRILETFLWFDLPILWYGFRIFVCIFFLFSISLLIKRYFNFTLSLLIPIVILSDNYFSDIFSRLGAGEVYCILGTSIILISYYLYNRKKLKLFYYYIGISLGSIIAMGSKENFLPFAIFPFILIILNFKVNKLKHWIVLIIPVIYSLLIASSILLSLSKGRTDIYGNSVELNERLILLKSSLLNYYVIISILILLISTIFLKIVRSHNLYIKIYIMILSFIYLVFNILFYNGIFPNNNRYDYPGILCFYIIIIIFGLTINRYLFNFKYKYRLAIKYFVPIFLILIANYFICFETIEKIHKTSNYNSINTQKFTNFIKDLQYLPKEKYLIIVYSNVMEFEHVDSLITYINFYNIYNNKSIYMAIDSGKNNWENGLVNYMNNLSVNGNNLTKLTKFELSKLKLQDCKVLHFNNQEYIKSKITNLCRKQEITQVPY